MNEVNASPVSPLLEHLSSCSSGKSSFGALELSITRLQTTREFLSKPNVDAKVLHVVEQPKKFAPLGGVDFVVLFR